MSLKEKQAEVLASIAAVAETVPKIGKVKTAHFFQDSEHDYQAIREDKAGGADRSEVKYLLIELKNDENTDSGLSNCPNIYLIYDLHLFHQYAENRSDASNSTADFSEAWMDLKCKFEKKSALGVASAENERLVTLAEAQHGEVDRITGFTGHFIDFRLRVLTPCDCS